MKELKVILKTLTPLWTGGVDGKSDRLHEIEIIARLKDIPNSPVVGGPSQHARMVGSSSRQPHAYAS